MDSASSLRNAQKRRKFRERAQPKGREKYGLLEKHKDYSLRAKDHNIKKAKLQQLRQKVLEKNPDEFYFGMMSQKGPSTTGKNRSGTKNGDRGNLVLSQDTVRLLKTQDLGYVRTMRNKATKEVESLKIKSIGIKSQGKKIVYVEDQEEQAEKFQAEDSFGGWEDEDEDDDMDMDDDVEMSKEEQEARRLKELRQKEAGKIEKKLQAAQEKLKALTDAEEALGLQRSKMAKSPSVGGITKSGKKFRIRERKR